ncbi:MAG: FAD-dependent oxidoreductase [Bacillota bacterium]
MFRTELAVVGAGPAGLSAALAAAECGVATLIVDNGSTPGGQLVKQTHKFFGSKAEHAGTRGIDIARQLADELQRSPEVEYWRESTALGYYEDRVLLVELEGRALPVRCDALVVATGAAERHVVFPGNDLPGIYGAGAVQTLMNVHGVKPGERVLMVGAGNIGLIVSYQLLQAGVQVAAVVEAARSIGGYAVHASKLRRLSVPILTSHTVKEAHGHEQLERATVWRVDETFTGVPGTEIEFDVDVICLAVGLSPVTDLLWQIGCKMKYVPELGGHVPLRNENMQTTRSEVFVAGDASGVEEGSSAMVTGRLAGYAAAAHLGKCPDFESRKRECQRALDALRAGPSGQKVRTGLSTVVWREAVTC